MLRDGLSHLSPNVRVLGRRHHKDTVRDLYRNIQPTANGSRTRGSLNSCANPFHTRNCAQGLGVGVSPHPERPSGLHSRKHWPKSGARCRVVTPADIAIDQRVIYTSGAANKFRSALTNVRGGRKPTSDLYIKCSPNKSPSINNSPGVFGERPATVEHGRSAKSTCKMYPAV